MFWFYVLVATLFAIVYAKMETLIESGGRKWQPFIGKYGKYHLWLGALNLVVNIPALLVGWKEYAFCVALFPLLEDIFYFAWLKKQIKPWNWTAKEGSVTVRGITIPYWYLVVGAFLTVMGLQVIWK